VNTDITDLKRAQEDLRRSESFLVEGQRLTRMGNFVWHLGTGDITWSEQLYRMYEFEPGTRVTLERIGGRVPPDDLPMMYDMVERAQRGESYFEYEHRLVMPDGSLKHLHLIAHAVHGENDAGLRRKPSTRHGPNSRMSHV
jgi:PAS domain-containing protein